MKEFKQGDRVIGTIKSNKDWHGAVDHIEGEGSKRKFYVIWDLGRTPGLYTSRSLSPAPSGTNYTIIPRVGGPQEDIELSESDEDNEMIVTEESDNDSSSTGSERYGYISCFLSLILSH